ncbi:hypothetical protein GWK47_023943 [Chionoecetes opilio]|uniref:Uncharacterized protein n=1 Tax=Chionoecetes opilio TaxID=41210 RepID=A0A8J5CE40_CHIOP|nr:hypothetical protein GWK47_023943 [Chionoecetes opilio]
MAGVLSVVCGGKVTITIPALSKTQQAEWSCDIRIVHDQKNLFSLQKNKTSHGDAEVSARSIHLSHQPLGCNIPLEPKIVFLMKAGFHRHLGIKNTGGMDCPPAFIMPTKVMLSPVLRVFLRGYWLALSHHNLDWLHKSRQ